MKFHVEPAAGDIRVPAHPIEGPMPAEGGAYWIADQYTLRLLIDEVIRRVPEQAAETVAPQPDPGLPAPAASTDALTEDQRASLKAEGLSDEDIAHLTPDEARDLIDHKTAPASGEAQEH